MADAAAILATLVLVAVLFCGLGALVFGSPSALWQAIVLTFTENQ